MKIVIAPDSFKDALPAHEAVHHIANGLRQVADDFDFDRCPIADGGEGFTDAIASALGDVAKPITSDCTDPLGRGKRSAFTMVTYPHGPRFTILELAAASGLELLSPNERDPTRTSTYGSGLLIRSSLRFQPEDLLIGVGGSATNDAGCGIAQALGARFLDSRGAQIQAPITGGLLERVARIDLGGLIHPLPNWPLRVACDVSNPLTGPNGAAHVYAPQKGATPEQVEQLDAGLRHIARLWRDQLGVDVEHLPGAGAAGGVGGGLVAMLGAQLVPGAELVLDTIGFDERIKDADLVITGEGRLDSQSLQGKAAMAAARRAQAAGVPCVALVGCVGEGAEQALGLGLTAYRVVGGGLEPAESIRRTGELLEQAAVEVAREYLLT